MSKRPHSSQASASAPEDLVERLKAAANNPIVLLEIVESSDDVSVAAAIRALLNGGSSNAVNDAKRRKKTRNADRGPSPAPADSNRPSIPNETLLEIMLFADRDALDAMQLVCRFLFQFIQHRKAKDLPLRSISKVRIGKFSRPYAGDDWPEHWLPAVSVARGSDFKVPDTVNRLVPYLRLAYCQSVCIDLRLTRSVRSGLCGAAYGAVFGDLILPNTFVGVLKVYVDEGSAVVALRAFEAFKPLNKVVIKVGVYHDWTSCFDEAFFISAAKCGVRSIDFDTGSQYRVDINISSALAFGFGEPAAGGERSLSNVFCDLEDEDFLAQLIEKASELDGRQHIDFKFSIADLSEPINPGGYEKYQKGKWSWRVDDLENGITVEIDEEVQSTEIHVFSSV